MLKQLILIVSVIFALQTAAQNSRLYTTQQGLATSNISTLSLDSHGLLWIAANGQLGYFDGNSFHYLPCKDPKTQEPYFWRVNHLREESDNHYLLGTASGLFDFDSRTLQYERIPLMANEDPQLKYSVLRILINSIDNKERIITTNGYGIYCINSQTKEVNRQRSNSLQTLIGNSYPISSHIDHTGTLWVYTSNHRLHHIDLEKMKQLPLDYTPEAKAILENHEVYDILEVRARKAVYIATDGGLLRYDRGTHRVALLPETSNHRFQTLLYTLSGQLLAGTDSEGVWQVDDNGRVNPYELYDPLFDLSLGKVRDMAEDHDGNIIIALLQRGIYIIPPRSDDFRYHPISLSGNARNSSCITSMAIDQKQNYWIGTDGAGVFTTEGMHMATAKPVNKGLRSKLIQTVQVDRRGVAWVGSYGGGVQCWNASKGAFETPQWLQELQEMPVMAMVYDSKNDELYVGTNGSGVYVLDLTTHQLETLKYNNNANNWIASLHIDHDRTLWIGDVGGIYSIHLHTGTHGGVPNRRFQGIATCLSSIGDGIERKILIGSDYGLQMYTPETDEMTTLIPGVQVQSIIQTRQDIWVSTTTCIYAVRKRDFEVDRYSSMGGFFTGEFHQSSALDNKAGNILFGCDNGIICLTPENIRDHRPLRNQLIFTSLTVGTHTVQYSDSTEYLDSHIFYATQLQLPARENSFQISFASPSLGSPMQVHYRYMLEGYDRDWNHTGDQPTARYSSLEPGKYTLHVCAYIEGDEENAIERSIRVRVRAPWYMTYAMQFFYLLILLGAVWLGWRFWNERRRQRHALVEALHNEEMKEAKLRLFTSITHELRTPLTMILSPLRQLMTTAEGEHTQSALQVMKHNCDRLLDIVRQITDIRKIDAGQFRLHYEEVELCQYTQHIAESFLGAATIKRIYTSIESSDPEIYVWIDPIHFEKVLVNILSNAFKFTPEQGRILVRNRRRGNDIEISIYNSGSHIDEGDLEHIYERFYQAHEGQGHTGSGIGLNLAFELVQLHHGTIQAHNVDPDGVEFTITLPLGCAHLTAAELEPRPQQQDDGINLTDSDLNETRLTNEVDALTTEAETSEGAASEEESHNFTLLIVDDDRDLIDYLSRELGQEYRIIIAFSGNSAWNLILQYRPDVVVTDMKMPDGDGISLCQRIKSNPDLDHTPVIMLTGEGDDQLHLASLQADVDHFVQKPFNMVILRGILRQVLRVRENLHHHIQRTDISQNYNDVVIDSAEDKLFQRIRECLKQHLDDSEFGVQELANEVGISRVHLNRKMKEKYGLSPNIYIRSFRLKQAAYLLVHNHVNVSEVAYKVGFSTHSYFSSSFREYFGLSPKEFVSTHANDNDEEKLKKLLE